MRSAEAIIDGISHPLIVLNNCLRGFGCVFAFAQTTLDGYQTTHQNQAGPACNTNNSTVLLPAQMMRYLKPCCRFLPFNHHSMHSIFLSTRNMIVGLRTLSLIHLLSIISSLFGSWANGRLSCWCDPPMVVSNWGGESPRFLGIHGSKYGPVTRKA